MSTPYGVSAVQNYLVPASGTTNAWRFNKTMLAGVFEQVDFRNISLNGRPFAPSGALIDNTLGTADCVVTILEYGYRLVCKAGQMLNLSYPAPLEQSVSITGEGVVNVIFVDYPVLPYSSATGGGGGGGGGGGRTTMFHGFQGLVAKPAPVVDDTNLLNVFSAAIDTDGWADGTALIVPAGVAKIRASLTSLAQGTGERVECSFSVTGGETIIVAGNTVSGSGVTIEFGVIEVTPGSTLEISANPRAAASIVGGTLTIEVVEGDILLA